MMKKWKLFLIVLIVSFTGLVFSACDPSIYDLAGSQDYNPFEGMEISQILDSEVCYNQLLDDLEFMNSTCYSNEKLAGAQAYTILMSYGLADMSKESSSFTLDQLETKANLFEAIKLINLYANNYMGNLIILYDPAAIQTYTNHAIGYCNSMLTYL